MFYNPEFTPVLQFSTNLATPPAYPADDTSFMYSTSRSTDRVAGHEQWSVAAFRLLLLTACRLSEIQFLRWEYVKDDCIELPDAKSGGRVVPLGPEARAVLAGLRRQDDNPWVIAGKVPGSHITDLQKPWRRIRARAGLEDVRIDDLRHSCTSISSNALFYCILLT